MSTNKYMEANVVFTATSDLDLVVAGLSLLEEAIKGFLRDSTDTDIEDELGVTREAQEAELQRVQELQKHFVTISAAMRAFEQSEAN